ncbi:MAG: peptidoglycan -binding protein [Proteobacteria bacterium]|nr:peptidoglycan -binding protein [Pseudomonadota bacterium]
MYRLGRGSRRPVNIWPGFVDALASLLLVVIFVLMVFMIAQYFLSVALSGRDDALTRLEREVNDLAELLSLERSANAELRIDVSQLSSELQSSLSVRESLASQIAALTDSRDALQSRLAAAETLGDKVSKDLEDAYKVIEVDKEKIEAQLAQLAILEKLRDDLTRRLQTAEVEGAQAGKELEDAYKVIEADKEKIEAQLLQLVILEKLRDDLARRLQTAEAEGAQVSKELEDAYKVIEADKEKIQAQLQDLAILQSLHDDLVAKLAKTESDVDEQKELTDAAQTQLRLLNRQIMALRRQLATLATALEAAESANKEQEVQISDLGRRLNVALASKVQELARYRSEFFGRLREVLGNRQDVRIVGDRFVFQSEVLFETGSAELGEPGQRQLAQLARTLSEIAPRIPKNLPWVLQVDGHTDRVPIHTPEFPSNWELSTARAISVVRFLMDQGIAAEHLAATGFGEYQPLDPGLSADALRRNRRIELKLTQR